MATVLRIRSTASHDDPSAAALIAAGLDVATVTATDDDVAASIARERPDVVVADVSLDARAAATVCATVASAAPGVSPALVTLRTLPPSADEHAALLEAGAHVVLSEPVPTRVLVQTVRAFANRLRGAAGALDAPADAVAKLGAAFEITDLGFVEMNARTHRFLRVNSGFCAMIGYAREELLELTLLDVTHPDDRRRTAEALEPLLARRTAYVLEKRYRHKDGHDVWVRVTAAPVPGRERSRDSAIAVVIDITPLRQAEADLERHRDRLALAQRAGRIGVFDWDLAADRMIWSEEQEAIFGLAPGTFDGRVDHAAGFILAEDMGQLKAVFTLAMAARSPGFDVTFRIRRPDGAVRHIEGSARVVYDAGGAPLRVVGVNVDVTERSHADAEREILLRDAQAARTSAEAANRAKDEFLAMLGHELRNPLAAVHGAVLTARLDPGRADRALDIAKRQAEQLSRIVDDLLDVARITQGRVALRRERVDLRGIVDRAIDSCRALIESRHHTVTLNCPEDMLQVEVDPGRLEQVVGNIVGNAAKFTEPGGKIQVSVARKGEEAELRVRDTGIGIAPELLPRVFELFAQGERGLDRLHGGLGIGLTVVRRLIELHGGHVEANSAGPGLGAEFVVRLPAASASPAAVGVNGGMPGPIRSRVLVVEDNLDAAESMQMLLELLGHDVRVAYDGVAAIDVAQTERPDVMLVDIGLPGIDGYEVARRIRGQAAFTGVRLVAVTGYGREEDRRRAMAAGFDDHLVKPVGLDVLKSALSQPPAPGAAATPG